MKTTLIFLALIASGCEGRDKRVFSSQQPAVVVESKKDMSIEEVKENVNDRLRDLYLDKTASVTPAEPIEPKKDDVLSESALVTESGLIVDTRVISSAQKKTIWRMNWSDESLKKTEITVGVDNYQIQLENKNVKKWIKVPVKVWANVRIGDYWNKGPE